MTTFDIIDLEVWPMFLFLNVISALEGTLKDGLPY